MAFLLSSVIRIHFARTSNLVTLALGQIASHCLTLAMAEGRALSGKAVLSI
jgi:hypothetical protein